MLVFIEEAAYSVDETELSVEICVVLEGAIEREVAVSLFTIDDSASKTPHSVA